MTPTELHNALIHAVTLYDRQQSTRKGYNLWALPQYIEAVNNTEALVASGVPLRAALLGNFLGRLLDRVLKAAGEAKATTEEHQHGPMTRMEVKR